MASELSIEEKNHPFILKTPDEEPPNSKGVGWDLFQAMKKNGSTPAQHIVETGEMFTYEDLLQRTVRTALNLKRIDNLSRKDVVGIASNNHKNSGVPFLASQFLGLIAANYDITSTESEIVQVLDIIKPKIMFCSEDCFETIRAARDSLKLDMKLVVFGESIEGVATSFDEYLEHHPDEDTFEPIVIEDLRETATIFFSSGTTSLPKGITVTHYTMLLQSNGKTDLPNMMILCYSTLYWISGAIFLLTSIFAKIPMLIHTEFEMDKLWKLVESYKITFLWLTPYQLALVRDTGYPKEDISSLFAIYTGGCHLRLELIAELFKLFPQTRFGFNYGTTEVGGACTSAGIDDLQKSVNGPAKTTTSGKLKAGFAIKIVNPETEEILGPNQQGEIRIKTKKITNGYYGTDSSNVFDSSGWYKTGDLGFYDDEGYFYVTDRMKLMLKYRTFQIYPARIEEILEKHPAVLKSAVIGIPNDNDGEHAMGLVMLNNGYKESDSLAEDIKEFAEKQLADKEKLRGGLKIVKQLPLTPSQKVRSKKLREMVLAGEI